MAYSEKQAEKVISNDVIKCKKKWTSEGFHNLPQNILVKIFSYCTEKEIASSLCRVCVNWLVASRDSSLWKRLEFRGKHIQISSVCRTLHRAPHLQTVSFIHVPEVVVAIRQISRCNKEVKKVAIRFCTSMDRCIPEASLRNLIMCCPQLEVLDLKGTQFRAQWLYHELHKLKNLHHLNLGMNKYLRFQDLLVVVYNCRKLTELSLFQWGSQGTELGITDQDAVLIFDLLHKQLTSLKFDMQDLGPPAFKAILECRELKRLALNNAHQMPDQVSCSLAIQLPYIKMLTFREANNFSTDNFRILLSTPKLHLTKFDAAGCWHMDDKCLEALAFTCYETLQRLSVKCCKLITEDGIGPLYMSSFNALQCFDKNVHFNLKTRNNLRDYGYVPPKFALRYILHNCPNLNYLNAAHIGEMGLELLNKIPSHLPKLKVLIMDQKAEQQYRLLFHIASRFPQLKILQSTSEFLKAEHPYSPLY